MSQSNRQLSCSTLWPRGEKIKTDCGVCAPSMALKTEESRLYLSTKSRGSRFKETDNAEADGYGAGRVPARTCDMDKQWSQSQTSTASRDDLPKPECSFSACATISETARELCNAVSVSLGLTMEASETSDAEPALLLCAAGDQRHGDYLFSGQPAVTDYRCQSKQMGYKTFENTSQMQRVCSSRISTNERNFPFCESGNDLSSKDPLDTTHTVPCPYASLMPDHFCQGAVERPCRVYKPPEEASSGGSYQADDYSVKVKSEDMWVGGYSYSDKNLWTPRQRAMSTPHSAATNPAFICSPYERSIVRGREQWYSAGGVLRNTYPSSSYMKPEVGEWLDVAYNDPSLLHFDRQTTQVGVMYASPPGIVPLEGF